MTDEIPSNAASTRNASSRILSKKAANRIAAAKAYCVAMEEAGEDVPRMGAGAGQAGQVTS